jgi:nicotinate-nucleotide adenylyltransferase
MTKKIKSVQQLQETVNNVFESSFSRTPLRQRIEDIYKETIELSRYVDLRNLKEETGDLLASTLQLCNENGWDASKLVQATLDKIIKRQEQYKSLGRKINVVIIGGAYDPITVGHIKMAQFILNTSKTFDEAWMVPCASHLYGKKLESAKDRLEMCNLAAQVDGRIKSFDYEISNNLGGETYHFIKRLLEEDFAKDEYDFSYAIGLDNANTFDKWVNYQDLEKMIRFVVVSRQGIKRDEKVDWYMKAPHIFLRDENGFIPETSSTEVRKLLKVNSLDHAWEQVNIRLDELLDINVRGYIAKKGLYKT